MNKQNKVELTKDLCMIFCLFGALFLVSLIIPASAFACGNGELGVVWSYVLVVFWPFVLFLQFVPMVKDSVDAARWFSRMQESRPVLPKSLLETVGYNASVETIKQALDGKTIAYACKDGLRARYYKIFRVGKVFMPKTTRLCVQVVAHDLCKDAVAKPRTLHVAGIVAVV